MDESYKLPLNQHEAIYKKLEKEMLKESVASENPRVIILVGQPGAGKSKLIELDQERFFPDTKPVIINGDVYREAHPQSDEILKTNDKRYAERTDPDVRKCTKRLFDSALTNRRDIIFEGTMRNKIPIMDTIKKFHKAAYQVDILVLAVQGEVSRVRIFTRYEEQKERNKYGRWTSPESHDEAYKKMSDTVLAIESESPINSISVYNKTGDILYENTCKDGIYKIPPHTADAKAAIIREHIRPLTHEEQYNSIHDNIETNTSHGKIFFHLFGAFAEFERDIIRERTRAGLESAKSRGIKGGRRKK